VSSNILDHMSKIKSPVEKKAASYKKDHVVWAEYPKAFRKKWPRKKAKANRTQRHKQRRLLEPITDVETAIDTEVLTVACQPLKKWQRSSMPLGEHVIEKQKRRQSAIGSKKKRQSRSAD